MNRFTVIIQNLRLARKALLEESRAKKTRKKSSRKKKSVKMTFDSPELEKLFNTMPKGMQDLIKKGE
jgi:hypothetical protein